MPLSDMIYVPQGVCLLGEEEPVALVRRLGWTALSDEDEPIWSDEEWAVWCQGQHEVPRRAVWVDRFWIARSPVTNAEYRLFVDAGGYATPDLWDPEGWAWVREGGVREPDPRSHWAAPQRARHPVAGVTWWEARASARWAGHRLPTADEWEKAARGTDGRVWPWGNAWDSHTLNSCEQGPQDTTPVGSFPAGRSPSGCDDMAGNVDEWTTDPCSPDARGLTRGGTWNTPGWHCRCSHRCGGRKDHRNPTIGFRCGHDGEPRGEWSAESVGTPA